MIPLNSPQLILLYTFIALPAMVSSLLNVPTRAAIIRFITTKSMLRNQPLLVLVLWISIEVSIRRQAIGPLSHPQATRQRDSAMKQAALKRYDL